MTFFDYYDHMEPREVFYRPRLLNDLLIRLQGCKPIGRLGFFDNTELFSMFEFPNCSIDYRENTLSVLKNRIADQKNDVESLSLFIGQACIDEKGHLTSRDYLELIKETAASVEDTLLYIPHRTETAALSEELKKIDKLRFHQSSFPIEIELFMKKLNPVHIFGLSSTALYTLSKLYPHAAISILNLDLHKIGERNNRAQEYLANYFAQRTEEVSLNSPSAPA